MGAATRHTRTSKSASLALMSNGKRSRHYDDGDEEGGEEELPHRMSDAQLSFRPNSANPTFYVLLPEVHTLVKEAYVAFAEALEVRDVIGEVLTVPRVDKTITKEEYYGEKDASVRIDTSNGAWWFALLEGNLCVASLTALKTANQLDELLANARTMFVKGHGGMLVPVDANISYAHVRTSPTVVRATRVLPSTQHTSTHEAYSKLANLLSDNEVVDVLVREPASSLIEKLTKKPQDPFDMLRAQISACTAHDELERINALLGELTYTAWKKKTEMQ